MGEFVTYDQCQGFFKYIIKYIFIIESSAYIFITKRLGSNGSDNWNEYRLKMQLSNDTHA